MVEHWWSTRVFDIDLVWYSDARYMYNICCAQATLRHLGVLLLLPIIVFLPRRVFSDPVRTFQS